MILFRVLVLRPHTLFLPSFSSEPLSLELVLTYLCFLTFDFSFGGSQRTDFFTMYQSLLDAHTTYYLPSGYGAVYYTTPFAVKSKVVDGSQKFYTGEPPYPFELWVKVCGSSCAYDETMEGWEISAINGTDVATYIKSFSLGGGTYYDDGVRANSFISGSLWGQSSLTYNAMPPENFTVTLINPSTSESTTMTLPFAFGGTYTGWSRASMITANAYSSSKKRSHELFAERQLLDALHERAGELRKRSVADETLEADLRRVTAAISELSLNLERFRVDTILAKRMLRTEGVKALEENRLPFIPSPRERMEDVLRLQQALWSRKLKPSSAKKDFVTYHKASGAQTKGQRKDTPTAVEASVIPGDESEWTMRTTYNNPGYENYFEALSAYYGNYRNVSVLRLASFTTSDGYWTSAVKAAVAGRSSYSLSGNLIIDVTGNGGGLVCLNYATMAYLINAWSDLSQIYGSDIVYSEYDLRESEILKLLYQGGDLDYTDAYSPINGSALRTAYYTKPTSRTIGSKTSSYTQAFNWNPCGKSNAYFGTPSQYFDKIIVLTDGRCGSSCAYFLTQLRENDKVRVVSYGGLYGEPLATSSFAGGNVYTWDYVRSVVTSAPANPFSSYVAFNVRANYSPSKYPATPRQFDRLEADWYLPIWDSFWRYYNADNYNTTARYALYESVLPLFDDVPSGLPAVAKNASPSTETSEPPTTSSETSEPTSGTAQLGITIFAALLALVAIIFVL